MRVPCRSLPRPGAIMAATISLCGARDGWPRVPGSWQARAARARPARNHDASGDGRATHGEAGMGKSRLEAFSDGVIAILITIMVLDLKVPHGESLAALAPVLPVFLVYVLSFVNVGIYWNNHHHMLHTVRRVTGPMLWANLHLLFWLSLVPFATGWMGSNQFAAVPTALYGAVLLMAGVAYYVLQALIIRSQGPDSLLRRAIRSDWQGKS